MAARRARFTVGSNQYVQTVAGRSVRPTAGQVARFGAAASLATADTEPATVSSAPAGWAPPPPPTTTAVPPSPPPPPSAGTPSGTGAAPAAWAQPKSWEAEDVKHNDECKDRVKRELNGDYRQMMKKIGPTEGCPRCFERERGAAAREGWGDAKRKNEERQLREIREHRCTPERCGPVCTFGQW